MSGPFGRSRLFLWYGAIVIAAVALVASLGGFARADLFFLDRAFLLRGEQEPNPDIAIVAISERDFELGAPRWPWPRSLMARLIDRIAEQEPAVIAIDIIYTEPTTPETLVDEALLEAVAPYPYLGLSGERLTVQTRDGARQLGPGAPGFERIAEHAALAARQDAELATAVAQARERGIDVIVAAQATAAPGTQGVALPYPALQAAAGNGIGLVGIAPDRDGVLRRYLPYAVDLNGRVVYGLAIQAAADYRSLTPLARPEANGDVTVASMSSGAATTIDVHDGRILLDFSGPAGTYPALDAHDVLVGGIAPSALQGKIVFLGVTDPSVGDVHLTPFSGPDRMSGVEYHANATDAILRGDFFSEAPRALEIIIIIALGAGAIAIGRIPRAVIAFPGVLVPLAGLATLWLWAFSGLHYLLPPSGALAVLAGGFTVALADRVALERFEKQRVRAVLSRYMAPEVVGELLRTPGAAELGGKRAEITILFADIRGFTAIAERVSPEAVINLLNDYLSVMTDIIFRHGGTIDKFEGDAIVAFFGAPQRRDDDALRAVRAALEMRKQIERVSLQWEALAGAQLRIGVGINTGVAIVGNVGSARRMDYTVIGDAVNLASRLQGLTKAHGTDILISEATLAKIGATARCKALGPMQIQGRAGSVSVFEVLGLAEETQGPARRAGQRAAEPAPALGEGHAV